MSVPIIDCRGVCKFHGRGPAGVVALADLDLTVGAGEMLALTGPSGSGKSTLLAIVGLLDVPSSGDIRLFGAAAPRDQTARETIRRERLGFVFQAFNLVATLSASENVELALAFRERRGSVRRAQAEAALAAVGLEGFAARRPGQLSGGQQQRVAIARALVREPGLILADEPTANLDRASADGVIMLLAELPRRLGTTVLVSSHDPRVAEVADRVATLEDGRLLAPQQMATAA